MSVDYNLVRSKRKTVALYVLRDGSLLVRAPLRASNKLIDAFVGSKQGWIGKQRQKLAHQVASQEEKSTKLESILYLGESFPVKVVEQLGNQPIFDGTHFLLPKKDVSIIETWFRRRARQLLEKRVAWFSRNYYFEPKKLRITSARTRWGSCSNRGTVSFSWRLIMAPMDVIDYVVVHELVHLEEKNHQQAFWRKVGLILPDFESHRKWLRTNGRIIMDNNLNNDY